MCRNIYKYYSHLDSINSNLIVRRRRFVFYNIYITYNNNNKNERDERQNKKNI